MWSAITRSIARRQTRLAPLFRLLGDGCRPDLPIDDLVRAAGFRIDILDRYEFGTGPRVGFTCSKKVGNAVARNRAKRRLRAAVDAHERAILAHALGKHRWNQRQTARALGLTYDQLRHCIRKHALMEGQD